MAEDLHNEGSEEEKKQNAGSQDDDDFGLPDLEFEELEELDLDDEDPPEATPDGADEMDIEISGISDIQGDEETSSALDEGIDEVEDVLDSAQLISDRLGNIEDSPEEDVSPDLNYDELLGDAGEEQVAGVDPGIADDDLEELESIDINTEDTYQNESDDELSNIGSPDELAALGIVDGEDASSEVAEESSESLFAADPDVSGEGEESNVFGDDDFEGGSIFESDEISLQPEQKEEFEPADEAELPPTYKPYADDEAKGGFAKTIIFGAIGFALVGFIFYFFYMQGDGVESPQKKTPIAKVEKPMKKTNETAKSTKKSETPKTTTKDTKSTKPSSPNGSTSKGVTASETKTTQKASPAPKVIKKTPKPASTAPAGEIVEVREKSGRSYIVIGSFIDEDLANDFARELSTAGNGVKIIFPFGNSKRYRVSIADFDSYAAAAAQMDSYKSSYEGAWALKY